MNKSLFVLFLGISASLASTDLDFSENDESEIYENAPYTVVMNAESYQVRSYPPTKWACAHTNLTGDKKEGMRLFMAIFDYIDGANELGLQFNMTAPVTVMKEMTGERDYKRCQMCFYIPSALQEAPPIPTGQRVYIEERPQMTVATRTFGGYMMRKKQWMMEKKSLENDLKEAEEPGVDLSTIYWAVYDSPMKMTNRRNEVWFQVKQ